MLDHGVGQTIYFVGRPERLTGVIQTAAFIAELATLEAYPPKRGAGLSGRRRRRTMQLTVVELTDPAVDEEAGTVSYIARIIDP
jgi:hypothetical protein